MVNKQCSNGDKTLVERETEPNRFLKPVRFTNEKSNVIARRNAEAIQFLCSFMDCFASLAMTKKTVKQTAQPEKPEQSREIKNR
ncbi:MAG: hypothetical protein LBK94_01485 [Prevotellaceae bacterium]|jgi:hypothetical protein|nr:hypothetical protein [Prevotellaceae bacterium]